MSNKSGVASQVLPLPQGGGAVQGIGETFSPDLFTGTGNFSIPIDVPPGRNGFQPQLNLVYSTGNGNGPFGLGRNLSVPNITRKTSKGLPRYDDQAQDLRDRDTFILSGAEDLVQITERDEETGIAMFRSRTEGLFAKIEHVLKQDNTINFWRVHSKDGLVSHYGTPDTETPEPNCMIGDPRRIVVHPERFKKVFAWMLAETRDTFGNRIEYSYCRDRGPEGAWDQLYLKQIRYIDQADGRFLASVTFSYEERKDEFSSYRSGFEIRTRLRCRLIEVRTHAEEDVLVRSYKLTYLDGDNLPSNGVSLLSRIEVTGHDGGTQQALPPLDFKYTALDASEQRFQPLTADGGGLPVRSMADDDHELIDLYGRGFPDLVKVKGLIRFWKNQGRSRFAGARDMEEGPNHILLKDPGVQFADLNGNGRTDLLVAEERKYYPLRFGGEFFEDTFIDNELPPFDFEANNTRFLDLDGDGVVDAMRTGSDFQVFFNRQEERRWFDEPRPRGPIDDNLRFDNPKVKLADMSGDGLQDFVLVDRNFVRYWPNLGDGRFGEAIEMRIRPIIQDNTGPGGFEPTRLFLVDIDGDGLDDLLYINLEERVLLIWINQSGKGWSTEPIEISIPFHLSFEAADAIRVVDMFGTGTAGVLWTADRGPGLEDNYQFLDLTGREKPYLLTEMNNNMGSVTHVKYAPSTKFYLADQESRKEWKTPLPFPVQVVERVEVIDEFSKGKLVTEYRYHHGYWNGDEREFRGFGMVEQFDTETFHDFNAAGLHGEEREFERVDEVHFSPPTLTKTWFHLGDIDDETLDESADARLLEINFENEYFEDDPSLLPRPEAQTEFLDNLPNNKIKREALRTLRGTALRNELYALDGPDSVKNRPYTVTESLYGVCEVIEEEGTSRLICSPEEITTDSHEDEKRRVFFPHQLAQRTTQWERGDDPMTQFSFTNDYDEFGQPRRQVQIACPRGWRSRDDRPDEPYLATLTRTQFAKPDDFSKVYIADRVSKTTSFEITDTRLMTIDDINDIAEGSGNLVIIGQNLNYYDGTEFEGLEFGKVGEHGAVSRTELLVLTEDILKEAYENEDATSSPEIPPYLVTSGDPPWTDEYPDEFRKLTSKLAGYVFHSGDDVHARGYFVNSARNAYDFQRQEPGKTARGLLMASLDPLSKGPGDREMTIEYEFFDLLPTLVTDAAGLKTKAEYDERLLQPAFITDPNENRSRYTYTPLGLLESIAVLGKKCELEGDERPLSNSETCIVPSTVFKYNFEIFTDPRTGELQPISVTTIRHVHHISEPDVEEGEKNDTIQTFEFSDGFGRLIQTRVQAEDVLFGDEKFGNNLLSLDQLEEPVDIVGRVRRPDDPNDPNDLTNVVVSGAQVFDNKGRVVQKFEPYYGKGFEYIPPSDSDKGKSAKLFYDPRGQMIRTENPDGSERRVVSGVPGRIGAINLSDPDVFEPTPWEAFTYDENDNAGRTRNAPGATNVPESHQNTPSSVLVDALGRAVKKVERNGRDPEEDWFTTDSTYDIRGNVVTITDALKREAFHYIYDLADRPLRTESIDAGTRRVILDAVGNEIERRDSKGALILQGYDVLNRPIRMWARDGRDQTLTLRERMIYGDSGETDLSEETVLSANLRGAMFEHYDEAGLLRFDRYDFKGNVLEKQRGVISDDTILNTLPPPGTPVPDLGTMAFRVDWQPADGVSLENHVQNILEKEDKFYITKATYDGLNRLKIITYPEDVNGESKKLRHKYNRAGALEQVRLDSDLFVDHIAYNAKGQRTFTALGPFGADNRAIIVAGFDEKTFRLGRSVSRRFKKTGNFAFRPIVSESDADRKNIELQDCGYEYDLSGNITAISDHGPEHGVPDSRHGRDTLKREFTYDALYRLVKATGRECDEPFTRPMWADSPRCIDPMNPPNTDPKKTRSYEQHYKYDKVGNMLELKHSINDNGFRRSFNHKSENNQLHEVTIGEPSNGLIEYEYDANGNMTRETLSRFFDYDHSDQMKMFRTQAGEGSVPSIVAIYLYDASGQRTKKLVRKQDGHFDVTVYIDGAFEHHRKEGPNKVQNNTLHVMDGETRIATKRIGDPFPDDETPAVKFHIGDHMGSSNVVISGDGNFVNREEYTPYGETSFGSFALKRYRFSGKERDEESGLYYISARYYAPWHGKWIVVDPKLSRFPRWSPYSYAFDNPINFVDRTGKNPELTKEQKKLVDNVDKWYKDVESFNNKNNLDQSRRQYKQYKEELSELESKKKELEIERNQAPYKNVKSLLSG